MTDARRRVSALTPAEKIALVSGRHNMHTNTVPRAGISQLNFADGPHGLRIASANPLAGMYSRTPATCFPTAAAQACGWNRENQRLLGEALGREARHYGIHVVLGPGINLKRDPRCGRSFEYYSEDPYLTGRMAAPLVEGLQSLGVGACLKHFACNQNERFRFVGDSAVDERALEEVYLASFRHVVIACRPFAVMSAYNRLNGTFCAENAHLLTRRLRREWHFDGLVMSDWGAVGDRVKSLMAGNDLEMPGDVTYFRHQLQQALQAGTLPPRVLDEAAARVLTLGERCVKAPLPFDADAHHELAARIAADCGVLLKNEGTLPLASNGRYLACGPFFRRMRYQGSGSSMVTPTRLTSPRDAFLARGLSFTEDAEQVSGCDAILYFGGLTDQTESEGTDRTDLSFPPEQLQQLQALTALGKPLVLVLMGGGIVELPCLDELDALLYMGLPGQNGGEAIARLLLGEVTPSGKLAQSWPRDLTEVPAYKEFGSSPVSLYRESVFVGYRGYETAGTPLLFPFGFGLSYTAFRYSCMQVTADEEGLTVTCTVENTGSAAGAETVQLYTHLEESALPRPKLELKGFDKVYLEPGERKQAVIRLPFEELKCFHPTCGRVLENGTYTLHLAASCRDIRLTDSYCVTCGKALPPAYPPEVTAALSREGCLKRDADFEAVLGRPLPREVPAPPFTVETRLADMGVTPMGRLLRPLPAAPFRLLGFFARLFLRGEQRDNRLKSLRFLAENMDNNSLRSLCTSSAGVLPYHLARAAVHLVNGRPLTAIGRALRPYPAPRLPKARRRGKP